jgi:septum formation inhibitor-activating ATPase MinD
VQSQNCAAFHWVISNSLASIDRGALLAMRFADAIEVVTNPEIASMNDSNRTSYCSTRIVRRSRMTNDWKNTCLLPAMTRYGPCARRC